MLFQSSLNSFKIKNFAADEENADFEVELTTAYAFHQDHDNDDRDPGTDCALQARHLRDQGINVGGAGRSGASEEELGARVHRNVAAEAGDGGGGLGVVGGDRRPAGQRGRHARRGDQPGGGEEEGGAPDRDREDADGARVQALPRHQQAAV